MHERIQQHIDESQLASIEYNLRRAYATGYTLGRFGEAIEAFYKRNPTADIQITTNGITLNGGTREMVLDFIKTFPGTWTKTEATWQKDKLKYTRTERCEFMPYHEFGFTASDAPPPPSCRVEEVEELVPASVRKVRKLVCTPKDADDVPLATPASEANDTAPTATLAEGGEAASA